MNIITLKYSQNHTITQLKSITYNTYTNSFKKKPKKTQKTWSIIHINTFIMTNLS